MVPMFCRLLTGSQELLQLQGLYAQVGRWMSRLPTYSHSWHPHIKLTRIKKKSRDSQWRLLVGLSVSLMLQRKSLVARRLTSRRGQSTKKAKRNSMLVDDSQGLEGEFVRPSDAQYVLFLDVCVTI
jgi:hypothetical protein